MLTIVLRLTRNHKTNWFQKLLPNAKMERALGQRPFVGVKFGKSNDRGVGVGGWIAIGTALLVAAAVALQFPEIRRYLKMRSM